MKKTYFLLVLILLPKIILSQGMNNTWLLGYNTGINEKSKFIFNSSSYLYNLETRKMPFQGTEATISDDQGNFLMSSNGVWIANAINDTMMNGAGLNPGPFVNGSPNGLVIGYGNIFLPFPGDSTKYYLFHQTGTTNLQSFPSFELFFSVIDLTLSTGLGEVISKNNIVFQDTLTWGIAACKHGNGRDWWVIAQKDSSDIVYKILLTTNGVESITTEALGYSPFAAGNVAQVTFSPDGSKFIQNNYDNPVSRNSSLIISDFDRCSGTFSNTQHLQLTNGTYLYGLAFSPSGEFIYTCNSGYVFQISSNNLSVDTVATYDGFISGFPPNCCATTFWNMYLAANGKIYITSGSSVQHIHEMNYPDSAGVACDVQQHAINLGVWNLRSVPNHPNYYLGALTGSTCDTLTSSVELVEHDFKFSVSPNPSNGNFRIMYLLPQNKNGKLEIFDINGRRVYEMNLPQWSTMQYVSLPENIAGGVHHCAISAQNTRQKIKVAVIR